MFDGAYLEVSGLVLHYRVVRLMRLVKLCIDSLPVEKFWFNALGTSYVIRHRGRNRMSRVNLLAALLDQRPSS